MSLRERLLLQAAELRSTHRRLALRHAEVEEHSGEVHDDAARVYEGLSRPGRLDPATLRAHAEQSRARAAVERQRAQSQPEPRSDGAD